MDMLGDYTGPIFSPSQTRVYLQCPFLWYLSYVKRFESNWFTHKDIAGVVGSAFSVYTEFLQLGHDSALERAKDCYSDRMKKLQESRECVDTARQYLITAEDRLERLCNLFKNTPVIPASWDLFDQERAFPRWGGSRVDVLYETSMGVTGVLDYKTRSRIQKNQVEKTKREFATSDQLYHYCAMVSHELDTVVEQFSICILTLEPRPYIDLWQFRVKENFLQVWMEGRKQVWTDMQAVKDGHRVPHTAAVHEDKYGKCPAYNVCFKYDMDEGNTRKEFYVRN